MAETYGITLHKSDPWYLKPAPEREAYFSRLQQDLLSPGKYGRVAILLNQDHYTELTAIERNKLVLFDSNGRSF